MQNNFKDIKSDIEIDAEIEFCDSDCKNKEDFVFNYITENLLNKALEVKEIELKKMLGLEFCRLMSDKIYYFLENN